MWAKRYWIKSTHYAASLMNFFSSDTRLLRFNVDATSVTTQYWISLKRLMKTSRFDVIWTMQTDSQVGRRIKSKKINFPAKFVERRIKKRTATGQEEMTENFFNYIKFAFFLRSSVGHSKAPSTFANFFCSASPFCDCYLHSQLYCARRWKVSPSAEQGFE